MQGHVEFARDDLGDRAVGTDDERCLTELSNHRLTPNAVATAPSGSASRRWSSLSTLLRQRPRKTFRPPTAGWQLRSIAIEAETRARHCAVASTGAVLTPITDSCRGLAFLGRVARGAGAQLAAGLRLKSVKRGLIMWLGSAPLLPHKPGLTKPDGRTRLTEADAENLTGQHDSRSELIPDADYGSEGCGFESLRAHDRLSWLHAAARGVPAEHR